MKRLLLTLIKFYRKWISPMKPPTCRFYPTCSAYGLEAIDKHGVFYGGWLTTKRIVKCAPWHPGGFDPVPEVRNKRESH